MKFLDILFILSQNLDHVYMLEPPHRGGSNKYPQLMLWTKNEKKKNAYLFKPQL